METRTPTDGSSDASALHQALVDKLQSEGHIRTPRVEAAFRAIPRHLFLPGVALDRVYSDEAIATKFSDDQAISSSSQPAIMAIMLAVCRRTGSGDPGCPYIVVSSGPLTRYVASLTIESAFSDKLLEQLELEPGHRVLEIGAGTGYNAALIAHIVGDTGQVVTVDIDEDIVESAREHLAAAGFDQVQVVCFVRYQAF